MNTNRQQYNNKASVMRKSCLILALMILLQASMAFAAGIATVWDIGEMRTYRFSIGSAPIGTHTAKLIGSESVPGVGHLYLFEMKVMLDMTALGQSFRADLSCSLYCDARGTPKRYISEYVLNDERATLRADIVNDVFMGSGTGSGFDTTFSFNIPPATSLADNNFISQWEIAFYSVDLTVGSTQTIDILIPQLLKRIPMEVTIVGREQVQFGDETVKCTVAKIDLIKNLFYIADDGRLLRVVDTRQNLIIDLLTESEASETPESESVFWSSIHRRAIIWAFYAAIAMACILLFARGSLSRSDHWLLFAMSGITFALVVYVQAPIQQRLSGVVFRSIGSSGTGTYVAALVIAAVSGLFQEAFKSLLIWFRWNQDGDRPNLRSMIALGAMVGAGFGMVEACWLTGGLFAVGALGLVSLAVWERLITILFHTAMGAILGYGIGRRQLWQFLAITAVLHGFGNFTIVFVRHGYIDAFVFEAFLTVYDLALFIVALVLLHKVTKR